MAKNTIAKAAQIPIASRVTESKFTNSIKTISIAIIVVPKSMYVGGRRNIFVAIQTMLALCLKFLPFECFKTFKIVKAVRVALHLKSENSGSLSAEKQLKMQVLFS